MGYEGSVQTVTRVGSRVIATMSCEGATRLWLDEATGTIHADFEAPDWRIELVLTTRAAVQATWSALRTR